MNGAELYATIKTAGALSSLKRAKFKLTGGDRARYLNGQVSNDVRRLSPNEAMYACVMTAKGKMCADIFISAFADYLLVDADPSLRESLAARLERYIISDDVVLEDVTDGFSLIHLFGCSESELVTNGSPSEKRKSRRYGIDGWDLLVTASEFHSVWTSLASRFPEVDDEMLDNLRIEAGIPRWGFDLSEEILPVEAGLDAAAIDYHKGCYIGQEIISRLKSVGHVNKHLCGFISSGAGSLLAGMRLFAQADDKEIGWLTSVGYSFTLEKTVALGYLKRGTAPGTLNARSATGDGDQMIHPVLVKELPFIP